MQFNCHTWKQARSVNRLKRTFKLVSVGILALRKCLLQLVSAKIFLLFYAEKEARGTDPDTWSKPPSVLVLLQVCFADSNNRPQLTYCSKQHGSVKNLYRILMEEQREGLFNLVWFRWSCKCVKFHLSSYSYVIKFASVILVPIKGNRYMVAIIFEIVAC